MKDLGKYCLSSEKNPSRVKTAFKYKGLGQILTFFRRKPFTGKDCIQIRRTWARMPKTDTESYRYFGVSVRLLVLFTGKSYEGVI
jgi:hypothetical protein